MASILQKCCLTRVPSTPQDCDPKTRWLITIIIALAAMLDTLTTDIILPSLEDISEEYDASQTVANIAIGLPIAATAIIPLYWCDASETIGRRNVYILSTLSTVIFCALCAVSSSVSMLIIVRTLAAGASSACTPLGAAVVSDIWPVRIRGSGMSVLYVGILLGPSLAPVLGGVLTQRWGWTSTQWFATTYAALLLILVILALPETLSPKTEASQNAEKSRCQKMTSRLIDPIKILSYLRNPAVTLTIFLASSTYLGIKALQISIQDTFGRPPYSFRTDITGVSYIPLSVGLVLGNLIQGPWSDYNLERSIKEKSISTNTEQDLRAQRSLHARLGLNAWVPTCLLPIGLLWWGWSAQRTHWAVPMLASFISGIAAGMHFNLVFTLIVEILPPKSASLTALDGLGENLMAAIGSVAAQPLIFAIGTGWLFTALFIFLFLNVLALGLLNLFGHRWKQSLAAENYEERDEVHDGEQA